jgi:hypothetical protein
MTLQQRTPSRSRFTKTAGFACSSAGSPICLRPHDLRPVAENLINDGAAVECARRFLALVRAAAEHADYFGNWAVAFGATGLKGMRAHGIDRDKYPPPEAALEVDDYAESTGATCAELTTAPGTLTRRLIGPLLRALATEERYAEILND